MILTKYNNFDDLRSGMINRVWGDTEADCIRHADARAYFLILMSDHAPTLKLFDKFTSETGLYLPASNLKKSIQILNQLRDSQASEQEISSCTNVVEIYSTAFVHALETIDVMHVFELANEHVRENLNLPWDWLAEEMSRMWIHFLSSWAGVDAPVQVPRYESRVPPAPKIQYHFEPLPHESYTDMIERFDREAKDFIQRHKEQCRKIFPQGKIYDNQSVEVYVERFFRKEILGQPFRHIGRWTIDQKKIDPPYDRKTVKASVETAREWLNHGFTEENLKESLLTEINKRFPPGGVRLQSNSPTSIAP